MQNAFDEPSSHTHPYYIRSHLPIYECDTILIPPNSRHALHLERRSSGRTVQGQLSTRRTTYSVVGYAGQGICDMLCLPILTALYYSPCSHYASAAFRSHPLFRGYRIRQHQGSIRTCKCSLLLLYLPPKSQTLFKFNFGRRPQMHRMYPCHCR